jgi:gamma-glutamylputrescine oxidase
MNTPDTLSFWERDRFFSSIDVTVIGSGIVGLSAALSVRDNQPNARILVVERGTLPEGASTRNAGFVCFGSIGELLDDLKTHTEDDLLKLVELRYRGLKLLRKRIGDAKMDYAPNGGYEIFKPEDKLFFQECADNINYFNRLLSPVIGKKNIFRLAQNDFGLKNIMPQLIHNTAEGQIDTGKMIEGLLLTAQNKKIQQLNGLSVTRISDESTGVTLTTSNGWAFSSQKVIVATNGFARTLLPHLNVEPKRNQVIMTAPIDGLKLKGCFHFENGYFYFRNVGTRILIGGGRHLDPENESTDQFGTTEFIQNKLIALLHDMVLPQQKFLISDTWSGILGVGKEKKPIIQKISPNVVVAVRMAGMGVAIGSAVGESAANLIW